MAVFIVMILTSINFCKRFLFTNKEKIAPSGFEPLSEVPKTPILLRSVLLANQEGR